MKKKLSGLICLALTFSLVTGCTKDTPVGTTGNNGFGSVPEETASAMDNTPVITNGTFSMPINASYGWDPFACTSMENRAVMQLIYEGLFTLTPTFDAEPVLCKECSVTEDGLIYYISLQDACFSDGRTITAEDVVYSFEKAAESSIYASRFRDVNSMAVDGTYEIVIYMNNPNDRLPCMLDFPIIPNLSSTSSPLGTGPFVRDGTNQLVKNTNWWQGADKIAFTSVGLFSSKSAEDTRDNFEIDTIQMVYNDPNSSTAATYHCDYELWNSRSTVMQYLGFNMNEGIFQEEALRSAVLKAIDRSEIAENVYHNFADAAVLPVSPVSDMYDDGLARQYSYNRETALDELMDCDYFYLPDDHPVVTGAIFDDDYVPEATDEEDSLLEEDPLEDEDDLTDEDLDDPDDPEDPDDGDDTSGDKKDPDDSANKGYNPVTMLVMSGSLHRQEAAELVAEQLTNVGFTVKVRYVEYSEFIYTLTNQPEEWDLYYVDAYLTPDFDLRTILYPGNALNCNTVPEDEKLRSLYYKALENSGNRYDLYEYLMEKAYICPVLFENNAVFTTRGVFSGLNPTPDNIFYGLTNITINN